MVEKRDAFLGLASEEKCLVLYEILHTVAYTHLDVYKRQGGNDWAVKMIDSFLKLCALIGNIIMKKLGLFAAGVLFGTAGIKLLGSKDAKKVYAHTTAAALRAKEGVMKTVTAVREGAEDVYADAKAINECRAEAEAAAVVEDASAEESKAE